MNNLDSKRAGRFIIAFAILALIINVRRLHSLEQEKREQIQQAQQARQAEQEKQAEAERQATTKEAAKEALEKHEQFVARYLNGKIGRTRGVETFAIVAASDDGSLNHSIGTALADHLMSQTVRTLPAFFKPAFVTDGLFNKAFGGSTDIFNKLDLIGSLDGLVLAKENVQYSSTPSLDNVLTATMQLEVCLIPATGDGQTQAQTFTAHGAGFKQADARIMAEQRIIKQINEATNLTVIPMSTDNQNQ